MNDKSIKYTGHESFSEFFRKKNGIVQDHSKSCDITDDIRKFREKYNYKFTKCLIDSSRLDYDTLKQVFDIYKPKMSALCINFGNTAKTFVVPVKTMTVITSDEWTEYYLNGKNGIRIVITASHYDPEIVIYIHDEKSENPLDYKRLDIDKNLNFKSEMEILKAISIQFFI